MMNILFSMPVVWLFLLWVAGLLLIAIYPQRGAPPPARVISEADIDKLIATIVSPAPRGRRPAARLSRVKLDLRRNRTQELSGSCCPAYAAQFAKVVEAIRL